MNDSQSKAVVLYKFSEDGPLSQSTASLTDVVFSVSMGGQWRRWPWNPQEDGEKKRGGRKERGGEREEEELGVYVHHL